MSENNSPVADADRVALLQHGIVVVEVDATPGRLRVGVTGAGEARVRETVARRLGEEVEVDILDDLPRRLEPRRCAGYREREPCRLQVRFELRGDEHVDDIVVAEDERTVVVFATVCTSVAGEAGEPCEGPWHVSLERPLGDRPVIDGACGNAVPYKNVYADLA
jgi:hypothetical protein